MAELTVPSSGPASPASDEAHRVLARYIAAHGGLQGKPSVVNPQIEGVDRSGAKTITENPDPYYHYTFEDGTTLDMSGAGQIKDINLTKPPTSSQNTITRKDGSVWNISDPLNPKQVLGPGGSEVVNPDEDILTAIKRQGAEAERAEREANQRAGKGYITDADRQAIEMKGAQLGLDRQRIEAEIKRSEEASRRADEELKIKGAVAGAQVGQIGAETDLTRAQIDALGIKTASDADRAEAAGLVDRATAAKIRQQLTQPEPVTTPVEQRYLTRRDPTTGALVTDLNPNYQAKTRAQVAEETTRLQGLAKAKQQELLGKISGAYTPEQAQADFDTWYDQNVSSQAAYLDAAAQDAALVEAKTRADLATLAGNQRIEAFKAGTPYRVGEGYGNAFESLVQRTANTQFPGVERKPVDLGTGWSTFKGPNLDEEIRQTQEPWMQALAGVSPTAAQATGGPMPNYGQVNPAGALARSNYGFGGAPAPQPQPQQPQQPGGVTINIQGGEQQPGWQRADQAQGMAPPGNQQMPPGAGPAGSVLPGSPQYLQPVGPPPGSYDYIANMMKNQQPQAGPASWMQSAPNFGAPKLPPYVFGGG